METLSSLFKSKNVESTESVLLIETDPLPNLLPNITNSNTSNNKTTIEQILNIILKTLACSTLIVLIIAFIYIVILISTLKSSIYIVTNNLTNITKDLDNISDIFSEDGPILYSILEPLLKYIKQIAQDIHKIVG